MTGHYIQIIDINTKFSKIKEKVAFTDYKKMKDLSKNVEWSEIYANKDVNSGTN